MAIHYMDFYVIGVRGYPAGNMSRWVYELVDRATKVLPNWTEIRMNSNLFSCAFSEQPRIIEQKTKWESNEGAGEFLAQVLESGLDWQDFGIIRKTEADSMDYKIVGTEGYKPHHSHMESIAAGLVADATARCDDWKEIRIDESGLVFAYDTLPYRDKRLWDFDDEDGGCFRLTDLSTELEVGLNWKTFGIIRTEEAEVDAKKFTAKLSDKEIFEWKARNVKYQAGPTVWQNAHVEQPERTIADIVTLAERTTLTPDLITALSDWPDSALETIAQAIADGRIVLGGAK